MCYCRFAFVILESRPIVVELDPLVFVILWRNSVIDQTQKAKIIISPKSDEVGAASCSGNLAHLS